MMTMAVHKPRLVIVDAGRSFELLLSYFTTKGLTTHTVTLTSEADVSLPPFVHALRLLDDRDVMTSYEAAERQARINAGLPVDEALVDKLIQMTLPDPAAPEISGQAVDEDEEEIEKEKRDLLGEMLIAAIMMITGGETEEVARMSRADRYLVTRAIIRAATVA